MAVLPPGVGAERFEAALTEFRQAVGAPWVFTDEEDLFPYRDPYSFHKDQPEEKLASAAVAPDSVEQVQVVVRIANRHRIPLYAISTGKNYAYGGASPTLSGSVIVDLKRMNRVLEVDEHRHFALVEPGVSYFDLYRHIQDRGLKVWVDTTNPGWGGPIGNALERGIGYTMGYYRDHIGSSIGIEVVLANGEVMRTGMGAMPGSKTWQDYRHGFGPDPSGLFAQGNFGIVTKMGFRLMPQPEHWRTGKITVPRRRDLIPLVNMVNYLNDLFMLGEPWYDSPLTALLGNTEFREAVTDASGFDDAHIDRMAAAAGLHAFQVELQFYGSERTTLAQWEYAQELIARSVPAARSFAGESLRVPLTREQIQNPAAPYPTRTRGRGATQGVPELGAWHSAGRTEEFPDSWLETHTGLNVVIPRSGELFLDTQQRMLQTMTGLGLPTDVTAITTPLNWDPFSFFLRTFSGRRDRAPQSKEEQVELMRRITEANASLGLGVYRAPNFFQDEIAATYSFSDSALRRFQEALKDAVDPNGILSPGRGGVWPAAFRPRNPRG